MITLRHHALSLAAVFLALAVGVLLGSGVLSDSVLAGARADQRDAATRIDDLTAETNRLDERLASASDFDTVMAPRILRDVLAGRSVLLVRTPDAADPVVDALTALVGDAGGRVTGTVGLTRQFVDADDADRLRAVLGASILPAGATLDTTLVDQGSQLGDLLGIVALTPRAPTVVVDDAARATALSALRETGFLTVDSAGGQGLGAADTALVITGGALPADAGNQGSTVARFAAALAPRGVGTVLVGTDGSAEGTAAVAVTRADAALAADASTVDDAQLPSGRITALLGLRARIDGEAAGHFGTGPGATALTTAP